MRTDKQLNKIFSDFSKTIEEGVYKKIKEEISEDLKKELEDTAPVVTWKLKWNFYTKNKKKAIIIKDRMKYWFSVEFGPHSKPSMWFSRRALSKILQKKNLDKIFKRWK